MIVKKRRKKVTKSAPKSKKKSAVKSARRPKRKIRIIKKSKPRLKTARKVKTKKIVPEIITKVNTDMPVVFEPPKRTGRIYWPRYLDLVIDRYNKSTDDLERNKLFNEYLEYPLGKIAENVINRFKFPYMEGGFHHVKKEVIGFLVMNLSKYTPDKGKSFSYFSVIAKNYLILHNNLGYKSEKNTVYLSDIESDDDNSANSIEELPALQATALTTDFDFKELTRLLVDYWERNIPIIFPIKRDSDIAYGILELISQADKIENHSKKAAFLFLREMTNSKTAYISKVVSRMKRKIMQQLYEYKTEGILTEDPESKFFQL